ncbi:carboxypeptidase Taq (M32) metallopeptidase family protein [Neorickettsia helminthoeca str. Oregon]|uniref:Carboxypeptidase Taq (M32) metallopeptidase family protein n=1 Tax=Neorickettsia helminthoeca str. Oregon TaxID=1286528 RepID=X5HMS3_9RICK|nr:carboxypeptidase [Neorickettsia helminthoeca]AHX11790.1 carboxypeptidase Taq (M32) metallopeptidase family protein [Neorickettsia helminthoeca str. Oregon]
MEDYEKLERVFTKIDDLQKTLELLDFDVRLHGSLLDSKVHQIITLKEVIYDVVTSDEVALIIDRIKAKSNELSDWQCVNFGFMQDFCIRKKNIPFDLVKDFTEKSLACRVSYAEARKARNFEIVKEDFWNLLEVVRTIAALHAKGTDCDKYTALLRANQIDPEQLEQLCIGVSPLLKMKVQNVGETLSSTSTDRKEMRLNYRRIIEKFFPKNVVRIDFGDHFHLLGEKNGIKLIVQEKGEAVIPSLMFLLGQGLYMKNLPYDKWRAQPICNPTSIAMYAAQGFLFSHFLFEEKGFAKVLGVQEKPIYSGSIMGANKFVALTHLMIRFSLERSLINGEVSLDGIQELFTEDLSYYFRLNDQSASILDNHHWFFGEFCYYPSYLKGMIAAGQIFHMMKSENAIYQNGKPMIKKLITWLNTNVCANGARYSMDELINKLTGENLDCRFFKKFDQ